MTQAVEATPRAARAATLELRDVSVAYGGIHAVDGVSLSVAPGELLGLIGPLVVAATVSFAVCTSLTTGDPSSSASAGRTRSNRCSAAR